MRAWIWLVILLSAASAFAQTPVPGSSIEGRVSVPAGATLPEMIVYLQSPDTAARFAPPANAIISQKGAKFTPPWLIICVGQSVEFHNDEATPMEHNVFSRSGIQPFDLGLYKPPLSKTVTFTTPGVVRLYCSIHRLMDGLIFICPTPFWAKVESDGTFSIKNVPAGNWRIKTWQRSAKYDEQERDISTGASPVVMELRRK